jgi:hypothetical protein
LESQNIDKWISHGVRSWDLGSGPVAFMG